MKNVIAAFGLVSLLVMSLAWASDSHGIIDSGQEDAVHHHERGTVQTSTFDACHVFHCQALTHLSSIPSSDLLIASRRPVVNVIREDLNTLAGITANIIRPPIV